MGFPMPATGSTLTSFDAFLKDNYTSDEVARTMNENHVFLDMLDTKKRGTGRRWIVPLIDSNPQGAGATLLDAQSGSQQAGAGSNIQGAAWTINWGEYDAAVQIGDKIIDASASDMGAFFEDQKEEIDGLYRNFADIMTYYLLQDQGRALGFGTISAGVITLAASTNGVLGSQAIVNFEVGQILLPSANDGTSTAHVIIASAGLATSAEPQIRTASCSASGRGILPLTQRAPRSKALTGRSTCSDARAFDWSPQMLPVTASSSGAESSQRACARAASRRRRGSCTRNSSRHWPH